MAKKGQKYRKHSPEFKLSVIMDMRENHLGIMETERKYDVKHNVISKWERIFLEEGAEGLMKERRGRASKVDGIAKGRPPKLDKKIEEDLIAENQRLRMENEYLKKLSALVRKRMLKEEKKQQKAKKQDKQPTPQPISAFGATQQVKADSQGVFTFVCPLPGWWAFSTSMAGDPLQDPEGKQKPLEIKTIFWVYMNDCPKTAPSKK